MRKSLGIKVILIFQKNKSYRVAEFADPRVFAKLLCINCDLLLTKKSVKLQSFVKNRVVVAKAKARTIT
jgi:hypothetical protein